MKQLSERITINHGSVKELHLTRVSEEGSALLIYSGGGLNIIITVDDSHHGLLFHCSIAHKHRYPTWDEIVGIREALLPHTIDFMMMLPKLEDYINLHPNCFHLWQTPKGWDIQ